MPTATVLLCVRNGGATLEQQLGALSRQQFDGAWEVVLVDNASDDDTVEVAKQWATRVPRLRILEERRIGTNWARNCGVRAAHSPLVVCCDADDEVSPTWLRGMVEGLERFDLVGGALDPDRLNGPNSSPAECLQRTELDDVFRWKYALGANLGFRREVFDTIGGFDPAFGLGSDDVDFCVRAQIAGYSIGFVPSAVVDYRLRATARGVVRQRFSYGRGHQQLVEKHARLGNIVSRPTQRWKVVVVSAARLTVLLPQVFRRSTRLRYLSAVAYLAGRIVELVTEMADPRGHRASTIAADPR